MADESVRDHEAEMEDMQRKYNARIEDLERRHGRERTGGGCRVGIGKEWFGGCTRRWELALVTRMRRVNPVYRHLMPHSLSLSTTPLPLRRQGG